MIIRTEPKPPPEAPKKLIALVNDGRTTFINPQWPNGERPALIRTYRNHSIPGRMYGRGRRTA